MVKSSSVKRNAKNAQGLGRDRAPPCPFFPPPPHSFPSRARLIFALLVLIRPHYTILEPGTGYDVARFTSNVQTCLATIQVVAGCEKLLQKVES